MEEGKRYKVRTELVGRVPYEYKIKPNVFYLESDSGFGQAGAKLDPKTGALMHDKYQDACPLAISSEANESETDFPACSNQTYH